MRKPLVRTTLAMPASDYDQVDAISRDRGITRNAVIRDAVAQYLKRPAGVSLDLSRIAMLNEFIQAAVDILIRQQAPDKREEIILTVEQRMERFHGQK